MNSSQKLLQKTSLKEATQLSKNAVIHIQEMATSKGQCLLIIIIELAQPSYGVQFLGFGNIFVHSNESTVHGRMEIQGKLLRPILCGSGCSADRGCIGFAMKSSLCSLIFIQNSKLIHLTLFPMGQAEFG